MYKIGKSIKDAPEGHWPSGEVVEIVAGVREEKTYEEALAMLRETWREIFGASVSEMFIHRCVALFRRSVQTLYSGALLRVQVLKRKGAEKTEALCGRRGTGL